jgi:arsenite methyltransferase
MLFIPADHFDFSSEPFINVLDELSLWSAPFGLHLLENIRYRKNIQALDIGFGTGFPLTELAMRLGSSCRVFGIDPWEGAHLRTREKLKMYGISNVELIMGAAENIPIPDDSIDLITSNNGINNVQDSDSVYKECARVCRPGAQFIQTFNLNDSLMEFYSVMKETLKEMKLDGHIEMMEAHIYNKRKPLTEVIGFLEKNGFYIHNLIDDRFRYRFSDGDALFNHFFIRVAFMDAWRSFLPVEIADEIFLKIRSVFNNIAEANGSINLTIPFVVIDAVKK